MLRRERSMFQHLKGWAKQLKQSIFVLYFAYKDYRTPWFAKVFAACVVGYAFSPIDLIPDFIPILGYLDDVILVPLGIMIALKLIPINIVKECEVKAKHLMKKDKPRNWGVAFFIIFIWVLVIGLIFYELYEYLL